MGLIRLLGGFLLAMTSLGVIADVPESQRHEVEHLLEYVLNTACYMERNSKTYNGKDAHQHVSRKYEYFKDDIHTTEDFIILAATKSTFSGKYYMLVCAEKVPVKIHKWLQDELESYRQRIAAQSN